LDAFSDITAGRYFGDEKDATRKVTVTTYCSLRNAILGKMLDPHEYELLILDEAHRALGEKTVQAIEAFNGCMKIGFTATPEFHEEKSVADLLPFRIEEMSVREAIESNLLSGLRVYVMTTGLSAESVKLSGAEFEEVSLTAAINTPERNRFVADIYSNEAITGKRTVVYAASRLHGKALLASFEELQIPSAYVDGETSTNVRENVFEQFKSGNIKVLINARVLIEGFDEPEAEVCINAAPTLSKVVAEQRGGRILRRSRVKDSKIGIIVEVLDEFGGSQNTPVLFSEIAGAVEILSPSNIEDENRTKAERKPVKPGTRNHGEVIDDPKVIMDLTNKNKRQRFTRMFEYAPKGWSHARRLANELYVKESDVRAFAESLSAQTPEWFHRYLTATDILTTHYHPRLCDKVRKCFVSKLQGMITPAQYAERETLTETRASNLLEAADDVAINKAIRFADETYFSEDEHGRIIAEELKRTRVEESQLDAEVDDHFWNNEELSDEQRENAYWANFEEITSDTLGIEVEDDCVYDPLLDSDETDPFEDDRHKAFVQEEPAIAELSDRMRQKVRTWINLLPRQYTPTIIERWFNDLTMDEAGQKLGVTRTCIDQREKRAFKILRSHSRILFLWDFEWIEDRDLPFSINWRDSEIRNVSPRAQAVIDALQGEYLQHPLG
jgi:hypothetical protein